MKKIRGFLLCPDVYSSPCFEIEINGIDIYYYSTDRECATLYLLPSAWQSRLSFDKAL